MRISERNYERVSYLFDFCNLYIAHRDFDLAKRISRNKPLNWKQAESLSSFCNQLVLTNETKPQDFISSENESSDSVIDKYVVLKKCLLGLKARLGAKNRDWIYKQVKAFYKKRMFCYQMDTFYTWLIKGFYLYANNLISFERFMKEYCFEISLFTGKKKPVQIRQVVKISQYILKC